MNSFKIALMNFKNNIKVYRLYIMAMVFAVATYYNFWNLNFNKQVQESQKFSVYIKGAASMVTVFMVIFLIFFIMYSSKFFLNERKKEIGLYSFMGIDNRKIGFIFASENILLGLVSLVLGLGLGILFSKLFMMLLSKVALLDIIFRFQISKEAIFITIGTFLLIFILSFVKGYIEIIRMNLIDLINASKKEEEAPKGSIVKGLLSLAIILLAYVVALRYKDIGFEISLKLAVVFVILGSTWFFSSFFTLFMKNIIGDKRILYRGTNIFSLSNIYFRIQDNYKTLAAVTVLITSSITAFATVGSVRYFVDQNYSVDIPYTISYLKENDREEDILKETIRDYKVLVDNEIEFLQNDEYAFLRYRDFERTIRTLGPDNTEALSYRIDDKSVLKITKPGVMLSIFGQDKVFEFMDKGYTIKKNLKVGVFGDFIGKTTLVVSDGEYEKIKASCQEYTYKGVLLEDSKEKPVDHEKLTLDLLEGFGKDKFFFTKLKLDLSRYNMAGIVYFLGGFLYSVLMFATGSILYFKVLSESYKERDRFEILKNIGTTREERREAVKKQVSIYYRTPFLLGVLHSSVAIYVLSDLMGYPLYVPMAKSVLSLFLVLYIFYRFTIKKYCRVVEGL